MLDWLGSERLDALLDAIAAAARARRPAGSPRCDEAAERLLQRPLTAAIVWRRVSRASWCGIQCSLRRAFAVSISTGRRKASIQAASSGSP